MVQKSKLQAALDRNRARRVDAQLGSFLTEIIPSVRYQFCTPEEIGAVPATLWDVAMKRGRAAAASTMPIREPDYACIPEVRDWLIGQLAPAIDEQGGTLWFDQFPTDKWLHISPPFTGEALYSVWVKLDHLGMIAKLRGGGVIVIREVEYHLYTLRLPPDDVVHRAKPRK